MTFDPSPLHHMPGIGDQLIELLPEVGILHRLFGSRPPTLGFPAMNPLGNAFTNVFTV
jgi:hypothetical protein